MGESEILCNINLCSQLKFFPLDFCGLVNFWKFLEVDYFLESWIDIRDGIFGEMPGSGG